MKKTRAMRNETRIAETRENENRSSTRNVYDRMVSMALALSKSYSIN